jgi:hypothetical protein
MHDEQLNRPDLSPIEIEQEIQREIQQLDQRIVRALETVPEPTIPVDFAARVASRLPAARPVSLTPTHYGRTAMLICMVVTLAALVTLAVHTTGHATFGLLESLLFTQFIVLAVWFTIWRHSLR